MGNRSAILNNPLYIYIVTFPQMSHLKGRMLEWTLTWWVFKVPRIVNAYKKLKKLINVIFKM